MAGLGQAETVGASQFGQHFRIAIPQRSVDSPGGDDEAGFTLQNGEPPVIARADGVTKGREDAGFGCAIGEKIGHDERSEIPVLSEANAAGYGWIIDGRVGGGGV